MTHDNLMALAAAEYDRLLDVVGRLGDADITPDEMTAALAATRRTRCGDAPRTSSKGARR